MSYTRALKLRTAAHPQDDLLMATNLRGVANAHLARREFPQALDAGDSARALELGTHAVILLENSESSNSTQLAAAYHNLAAFQLDRGELLEARYSFEKALKIYAQILRNKHPIRMTAEKYLTLTNDQSLD